MKFDVVQSRFHRFNDNKVLHFSARAMSNRMRKVRGSGKVPHGEEQLQSGGDDQGSECLLFLFLVKVSLRNFRRAWTASWAAPSTWWSGSPSAWRSTTSRARSSTCTLEAISPYSSGSACEEEPVTLRYNACFYYNETTQEWKYISVRYFGLQYVCIAYGGKRWSNYHRASRTLHFSARESILQYLLQCS